MENHSEKGLKTIELLGCKPEEMGLVEIIWKKEKRVVPTKIACPTCSRTGRAYFEKDGSLALNKFENSDNYCERSGRYSEIRRTCVRGKCPTCPSRRGPYAGSYGVGEVVSMVERVITVGYIQWESGTIFDSRFEGGNHCGLCYKTIKSSGFVPVHGKDTKGQVHGLFVGEDCARKFLGIKKWKKDKDSVLNRP